jgi:predicted nucleotidyltransferase
MNELSPWKEHNQKVLSGEAQGRIMRTMPYGEDDFSIFEHPDFKDRFLQICDVADLYLEEKPEAVKGIILFGSYVNGVPAKGADIDFTVLLKNYVVSEESSIKRLNAHMQIFGISIKNVKNVLDNMSYPNAGESSNEQLAYSVFSLIGIPFGEEMIALQKELIEYIESLPDWKRETLWKALSKMIHISDTGYSSNMEKQKYGIIGSPLTFEKFKERWEKRVEFSRKFVEQH